ncbi:hypothetical protein [Streptomyces sp. 891-h]|uniref:hypothetical protein n=1 Tax=Streptomyces sp. 891-h TaxID=2720714 RepID=UPI001FAAC48F|nr:hypothetical protein [Streptomyces sp. 891-h]UNZ18465.1 hypothetical protein HC362_16850 [Streptomyces sp. 891-h]
MNDVMLPWPEPRRPRKDGEGRGDGERKRAAPSAPHYEIQRVNADGSTGPVEVLPITKPPWAAESGRRGFLGAGLASSVAAALLLSGCSDDGSNSPSSPSPSGSNPYSPSPTESDSPTPWSDPPTDPPSYDPTPTDTPTYSTGGSTTTGGTTYGGTSSGSTSSGSTTTGGTTYGGTTSGSSGSGGTICTCNKVCTCIPVCQAHELLNADPVVRRMAETVLVAMGLRELAYLRWAADEAAPPLRTRIEELTGELRAGRRLDPDELDDPGCEPYLTSRNPVIALMAAQVLTLRALLRGTRLAGVTADRAARALTTGHALHLRRAPAWSTPRSGATEGRPACAR